MKLLLLSKSFPAIILLCVVLTMAIGIPGVSLEMAAIMGAIVCRTDWLLN